MRAHSCVLAVLVGSLCLTAPALAQGHPVELGLDAGASFTLSNPTVTTISIPVQDLRAGFFVSDRAEVEPRVALNYLKAESDDALTTITAALGVLVHFSGDRDRSQPYLRPFGGLSLIDVGGARETQFNLGGGLGVKLPVAERMAARLEAAYAHGFETDTFASTDELLLTVGFSFFTR
ncbi:MAG TPA: outer membrane beta-barrel protein [Gemmatimonadales bacterium]